MLSVRIIICLFLLCTTVCALILYKNDEAQALCDTHNLGSFASSVHFDVPLLVGFELRQSLTPINAPVTGHNLECIQNAGHHPLEATKVHHRSLVQSLEQVIGTLLQDVLHIQLASINGIGHFPTNGVRNLELTIGALLHDLQFVRIQQPTGSWDTQNQPRPTIEHVSCHGVFHEKTVQKRSKGCNACKPRVQNDKTTVSSL